MKFSKIHIYVLLALFIVACSKVAITGRRQLALIPNATLLPMSFDQYKQFLSNNSVSSDPDQTQLVKTVGTRIQKSVEEYMAQNRLSDKLNGFQWEFNLIEDGTVNAWAMPGGKIVFYTGILPITQDEDGLAVVMGHEIAHVIAGHGNERMTQGLLAQAGRVALSVYMQDKPEASQQMMMAAYGAGAQVGVMLPFSRLHEREADRLGMIFMAMAGYDVNEAPKLWERMAAKGGGQAPPEFLSSHPSQQSRIEDTKAFIPEAMKYYKSVN